LHGNRGAKPYLRYQEAKLATTEIEKGPSSDLSFVKQEASGCRCLQKIGSSMASDFVAVSAEPSNPVAGEVGSLRPHSRGGGGGRGRRSSSQQLEMEYTTHQTHSSTSLHHGGQQTTSSFLHQEGAMSFHPAMTGGSHQAGMSRRTPNGKKNEASRLTGGGGSSAAAAVVSVAPGGSLPPCSCCFSARCRRENGSLIAAAIGLLSLACLLSAVATDTWIHTEESLTSRPVTSSSSSSSSSALSSSSDSQVDSSSSSFHHHHPRSNIRVHFTVGLWKVCFSESQAPPVMKCSGLGYSRLWNDLSWQQLGLVGPVQTTTGFISRMRISTVFSIVSVGILSVSTVLALIGHCIKGQKMLIASGLYAVGGLTLGCGLIMFVCVLSDEFGAAANHWEAGGGAASTGLVTSSSQQVTSHPMHHQRWSSPNYSYGWSFLLAVVGFLAAEFSAVLCLTAFLNRFESEAEFVKMVPGLERKITERYLTIKHEALLSEKQMAPHSSQEVPLLKGSFGHHHHPAAAVANDSSEESLYGMHGRGTGGGMPISESINSVIGLTRSTNSSVQGVGGIGTGGYPSSPDAAVITPSAQQHMSLANTHLTSAHTIPVTAEIELASLPPPKLSQPDSSTLTGGMVPINTAVIPPPPGMVQQPLNGREEMTTSFQSPPSSASNASSSHHMAMDTFNKPIHPNNGIRTLPRSLDHHRPLVNGGGRSLEESYHNRAVENNHHRQVEERITSTTPSPPPPPPNRVAQIHTFNGRKMVNSNASSSKHHMTTTSQPQDNGSNSSSSSPHTESSQRDSLQLHSGSTVVAAMATMPRGLQSAAANGGGGVARKKKSVTIGTFTTVETFDPVSYTSAV